MKTLITFIILLIAAVWLGFELREDNGYVLIHYGSWSIESTLWVAAIILLLAFIVFYIVVRLIQQTQLWPRRLRLWGRQRKHEKMQELTRIGIIELIDSKWHYAEQHLGKAAKLSPLPLVNYLGAAYAANQQGAFERCDHYLYKIGQKGLISAENLRLLHAQLLISNEQWEQAEINLFQAYQQFPKHPKVLRLLADVYQQQQKWPELQPLLPQLQKQKLLPEVQLNQLIQRCCLSMMQQMALQNDAEALMAVWRQVPPPQQPNLLLYYVQLLLQLHQDQQAIIFIERFLKQHWNIALLACYAKATSKDVNKQLTHAESWLNRYPQCPELLMCLGVLSMRCQLWGKARDYLTTALRLQPSAATYCILAQVYEALADESAAMQHYREGLKLSVADVSILSFPQCSHTRGRRDLSEKDSLIREF